MSTTAIRPTTATTTRTSLVRTGVVATVLAAAGTEVYAGVVRAAGVHIAVGNIGSSSSTEVGPGACAIMVVLCTAAGLVIAAGLNRWAQRPAHTFRTAAYVLTGLSFVPDLLAGATATSSKVTLMGAHIIAATIVIPLVSRALKTQR